MPEAERRVKLIRRVALKELPGVFRIASRGRQDYYLFREVDCEIGGRGWEVFRLTSRTPYHVRTGDTGSALSCDCTGFEARGVCRHVLGLMALKFRKLLDPLPKPEDVVDGTIESEANSSSG